MKKLAVHTENGKRVEIECGIAEHWALHFTMYYAACELFSNSKQNAVLPDHERLVFMELFTFNMITEIETEITRVIPGYFTDMYAYEEELSRILNNKKTTFADIKPLIAGHMTYIDSIFYIFRAYHLGEKYREREHIKEALTNFL